MAVKLSRYNGDVIEQFEDENGEACSLQEYLKNVGIFSSQFFVYLRTQKGPENENVEKDGEKVSQRGKPEKRKTDVPNTGERKKQHLDLPLKHFSVNGKTPGEIKIRYTKRVPSLFSKEESHMNLFSIENCYLQATRGTEREGYNPLEDGYKVTSVSVNHICYLDLIDLNTSPQFIYPLEHPDSIVILHTPDQIAGVESSNPNQLLLGVIIKEHNSGALFCWDRNDEPYASGTDLCFISVTEPGQYQVKVAVGELVYICCAVDVAVDIAQNTSELTTQVGLTRHSGATISSQDIAQSTSELTSGAVLMEHSGVTNSNQAVPQNSAEPTTQAVLTEHSGIINSSQAIAQNTSELTSGAVLMEHSGSTNSNQAVSENASELTTRAVLSEPSSVTNSSRAVSLNTSELTNEAVLTEHTNVTESSQAVPQNTCELTTRAVLTEHSGTTNSSQAISQNKAELTSRAVLTEHSCSTNSSRINVLNLSTDINVPEIPFDSLCIGPKIGEGSFGTVHKAIWLSTPVAVKAVKIRRMKLVQKALEREIKILSRVRHPHIIMFMGYSINSNVLHIVSEYIKGSNLDDLLFGDQCQQIPLSVKCHIAEKICQAVAYLHNNTPVILHRDIKPENIILSDTLETVKLCDLGIAKLLTINSSATTYAPGMQPGTPIFQAPEILLDNAPASAKSDVWGMAGTLAELFSERPMWSLQEEDEEDERSAVEKIINLMRQKLVPHAIQRLSQMDSIHKTIIDILTKGVDYDPDSIPSAVEFPKMFSV